MLGEGLFRSLHVIKLLPHHHLNCHNGLSEPSELTDSEGFPPQQTCPHVNGSLEIQPQVACLQSPSVWLSPRENSLICTKTWEIRNSQPSQSCLSKTVMLGSLG